MDKELLEQAVRDQLMNYGNTGVKTKFLVDDVKQVTAVSSASPIRLAIVTLIDNEEIEYTSDRNLILRNKE